MKKRAIITVVIYVAINFLIVIPYKFYNLHQLRHTKGKIVFYASYGAVKLRGRGTTSVSFPIIKFKQENDSFFVEKPSLSSALFYDPYDHNQEYDVYYKLNKIVKHYYIDSSGYTICLEANYDEAKCQELIYSNKLNIQKEEHLEVDNDSVIINKTRCAFSKY